MKRAKNFLVAAAIAGVALMAAASAEAAPVSVTEYPGNDPFPGTDSSVGNSISLAKCDEWGSSGCGEYEDGASAGDYSNAFSVTATTFNGDGEATGGSWSFDPGDVTGASEILYPKYVAVKAGNSYLVFAYSDGVLSGDWYTPSDKELSHISFYDTKTVVPLPGAAWLLLTALGGMGLIARRKSSSV